MPNCSASTFAVPCREPAEASSVAFRRDGKNTISSLPSSRPHSDCRLVWTSFRKTSRSWWSRNRARRPISRAPRHPAFAPTTMCRRCSIVPSSDTTTAWPTRTSIPTCSTRSTPTACSTSPRRPTCSSRRQVAQPSGLARTAPHAWRIPYSRVAHPRARMSGRERNVVGTLQATTAAGAARPGAHGHTLGERLLLPLPHLCGERADALQGGQPNQGGVGIRLGMELHTRRATQRRQHLLRLAHDAHPTGQGNAHRAGGVRLRRRTGQGRVQLPQRAISSSSMPTIPPLRASPTPRATMCSVGRSSTFTRRG